MDWYNRHKGTQAFRALQRIKQKKYFKKHTFVRLARRIKNGDKFSNVTKFELYRLARKQKLICPLTGRRLTNENISPDHVLPMSQNGTSDISNIRLVDVDANLGRRALDDIEFFKLCQDVTRYQNQTGGFKGLPQTP